MNYHFFLGGRDLEMVEIAAFLNQQAMPFTDLQLSWGVKISDYAEQIKNLPPQTIAVTIELTDDMPADWVERKRMVQIDHHGSRTAEASSLAQVFTMLKLPKAQWTRHFTLVAANDVGHIAALVEAGASLEEQQTIRAADRLAQGVTPQENAEGLLALGSAEVIDGCLTFVRLPHTRMATVTDPLALNPQFAHLPRQILAQSPGELGYFGLAAVAMTLNTMFPGGWWGGNPPHSGFWGLQAGENRISEIVSKLLADTPYFKRFPQI